MELRWILKKKIERYVVFLNILKFKLPVVFNSLEQIEIKMMSMRFDSRKRMLMI